MKTNILILPIFDFDTNYCRMNQYYFDALLAAGSLPLMCPMTKDANILNHYLTNADGILLPGGIDIDPKFYGEPKMAYCNNTDAKQDEMNFIAIAYALENRIPLMGICRGFQAINVYFNGTLFQDNQIQDSRLIDHMPKIDRTEYVHDVKVVDRSLLQRINQVETMSVNSIHHQGIKRLGDGLVAMAHAPDGLIEAFHYDEYIVAFQWHPEALSAKDQLHLNLFLYFTELSRNRQK